MSALLDSLLKRALPKPRDYTPVKFQGVWIPKCVRDDYLKCLRDKCLKQFDEPPTNGETA